MKRKKVDSYYQQAGDWGYDRYDSALVSKNRAFVLAILALSTTLFMAYSYTKLLPLKDQPYAIEINNMNGEVSPATPLDRRSYKPNERVTEHFIVKYVRDRERVDDVDRDLRFRDVQLLSGPSERREYVEFMNNSPASPIRIFKKGETRDVFIKNILHLNRNAVHVRFQTTDNKLGQKIRRQWSAVIDFEWGQVSVMDEDESQDWKYVNPLLFAVTKYRKDQEILKEEIAP